MAAICEAGRTPSPPSSLPVAATDWPDSMASFKSLETETVAATEKDPDTQDEQDDDVDTLVLAIRALRLLEDPQAAATEAIQAFDPKSSLHPELVRLLVAAAARHPDVAQALIELGHCQNNRIIRRTPSGTLKQHGNAARHASSLIHEVSISSLLSSMSESGARRPKESLQGKGDPSNKPTLKRRLSVLSTKKAVEVQPAPPQRREKISLESIKKICKANLKDTKESIEKLEEADLDDEFIAVNELKRRAEESLGHETGKFALCLALTLPDENQRWEAIAYLMTAMVDKLKLLLSIKGRFGPEGDVGLPGQDGFGIRDCWIVLSDKERKKLTTEDGGQWVV